jgi:hypothetical protein
LNSFSNGDPHVGELNPEIKSPPARLSETRDEGESSSGPSGDDHVGEPKPRSSPRSEETRDGLAGERNPSPPSITASTRP